MPLLVERLGDDTKGLSLRIGLHSGPVTAGVLRGDKARFQLFGDTVVRVAIVHPIIACDPSRLILLTRPCLLSMCQCILLSMTAEYRVQDGIQWQTELHPSVTRNGRHFDPYG